MRILKKQENEKERNKKIITWEGGDSICSSRGRAGWGWGGSIWGKRGVGVPSGGAGGVGGFHLGYDGNEAGAATSIHKEYPGNKRRKPATLSRSLNERLSYSHSRIFFLIFYY